MHPALSAFKAKRIATTRAIAKALVAKTVSKNGSSDAADQIVKASLKNSSTTNVKQTSKVSRHPKTHVLNDSRVTSISELAHAFGDQSRRLLVFFTPEENAMVLHGSCSIRCVRGLVELYGAVLRGPELFEQSTAAATAAVGTVGTSAPLEQAEERILPPHDPSSAPSQGDGPLPLLAGAHSGAAVLRAHPPTSARFELLQRSATRRHAPASAAEELNDPLSPAELAILHELLRLAPAHTHAAVLLSALPASYRVPHSVQHLLEPATFRDAGAQPTAIPTLWSYGSYPRALNEKQEGRALWHSPSDWVDLSDRLRQRQAVSNPGSRPLVVLVLGEQNAGKSSLCVHLCNSLTTAHFGRALLLDCDPGQPLLQPPGGLALHMLTRPLLSPSSPLTPLRTPLLAHFIGDTSPKTATTEYVAAVFSLMRWYHTLAALTCNSYGSLMAPPPLVVNTPGWIKGEGYSLLLDVLRAVAPSQIVELRKHARAMVPLVREEDLRSLQVGPEHVLRMVAVNPAITPLTVNAGAVREQQLGAYFDGGTGMLLARQVPYEVPFARIRLHLPPDIAPSETLNLLNGSLVALCCDPDAKYQPAEGTASGPGLQVVMRRASSGPLFWKALGLVSSVSVADRVLRIHVPLAARDTVQLSDLVVSAHLSAPLSLFASPTLQEGPYCTGHFLPSRLAPEFTSTTHVQRARLQKRARDDQHNDSMAQ